MTASDPPEGTNVGRKGKLMKSPFAFKKAGRSGIEVSELYPEVAQHIDDICLLRSMYTRRRPTNAASCS